MNSIVVTLSNYWEALTRVDAAQIKGLATQNVGLALTVCFISGILTSLTPCVYPMIPITINIFGRMAQSRSEKNRYGFNPYSFKMAAIYVLGMCTTYSVMGLVAGMTGSVFGTVLQSGWMLGFLCILFLTLSLGQLGFFKIQIPVQLQSRLAGAGGTHSVVGVFVMGLISGLIVSPCVGPVIAGILAFVFDSSNALMGFLYFLSFSLGLGVLFLLIGGFSGLINRIPRSGAWMVRVNYLLASLLLIASGYYGLLWIKNINLTALQSTSNQLSKLAWKSADLKAIESAGRSGKVTVIDFTADWCEACHVIEATVFNDPKVAEILSVYNTLRIDMTSSDKTTDEIAKRFEVFGLPAIVLVDSRGRISPHRVTGVLSAEEFLGLLKKVDSR